jgi:hypothetical protein
MFAADVANRAVRAQAGQDDLQPAQALSGTIRDLYFVSAWKGRAETLQRLRENGPSALAAAQAGAAWGPSSELYAGEEQELAIVCGEVPSPRTGAFPGIDAFARERSGIVGPYWAWDNEPCSTWPVRSTRRYTRPWDRRTANPVLVIGNTFDPRHPLMGGEGDGPAARPHPLLTMDGYGHAALFNPSSCVKAYEARYFIKGELPPKRTTLPPGRPPLRPKPLTTRAAGDDVAESRLTTCCKGSSLVACRRRGRRQRCAAPSKAPTAPLLRAKRERLDRAGQVPGLDGGCRTNEK